MLSHNGQQQQQPLNLNVDRHIPHRDRKHHNNFTRGSNNRTRALITPSPTMTHLNMANRFQQFLHSTPEAFNICNGNSHFTNQT